jgi:hypothetical protein
MGLRRSSALARRTEEAAPGPRAKRIAQPVAAPEQTSPKAHPLAAQSRLVRALSAYYRQDRWVVCSQLRSGTGVPESLRTADFVAVETTAKKDAPLTLHVVEVKETRGDWLRELRDPLKTQPFRLYASYVWLAAPAPWKRVVASREELPDLWGLYEVDGGQVHVVVQATRYRDAEDPSRDLLRALFRAADRTGGDDDRGEGIWVQINRPRLDFNHVGCTCGHVIARPLSKVLPAWVRCLACEAGLPPDVEVVERMIAEATPEERARYAKLLGVGGGT